MVFGAIAMRLRYHSNWISSKTNRMCVGRFWVNKNICVGWAGLSGRVQHKIYISYTYKVIVSYVFCFSYSILSTVMRQGETFFFSCCFFCFYLPFFFFVTHFSGKSLYRTLLSLFVYYVSQKPSSHSIALLMLTQTINERQNKKNENRKVDEEEE